MKCKIIPILLLLFLVASCGLVPPKPKQMYVGASLPIEDVSVISEGSRMWLYVTHIDGQYIVNPVVGGAPFTKGLHVLPGKHRIKVKYLNLDKFSGNNATFANSEQEISLETEKGHTYVLRGNRSAESFIFSFEDKGKNYNQECLAPETYHKVFIQGQAVPSC